MAKGQMRSNKEKKKPKAAHNLKKKGAQDMSANTPFASKGGQPGGNPYGKKG
jgi:hypothetical protein